MKKIIFLILFYIIALFAIEFYITNDKDKINKTELSSADLILENLNILTESVGLIECYGKNFYINENGESFFYKNDERVYVNIAAQGSASLWKINNIKYILTNKHVLDKQESCYLRSINLNIPLFGGAFVPFNRAVYNDYADAVFIPLEEDKIKELKRLWPRFYSDSDFEGTKNQFILSYENVCQIKELIGSKVYIIGFPAYTSATEEKTRIMGDDEKEVNVTDFTSTVTVSEGIISAYSDDDNLSYVNYYTSAKVDSGNSGGIALMKKDEKDSFCILGVPTWLNLGEYETGGIIQNIHNIMYQN